MLTAIQNWLQAPRGDYVRCRSCGRLRQSRWFCERMVAKKSFCPCGIGHQTVEPDPHSIRWHERLRIFLGVI